MTKKLTAVSGTISTEGLGINSDLALELSKKVDVVVNSAATTTFDERYNRFCDVKSTIMANLLITFSVICSMSEGVFFRFCISRSNVATRLIRPVGDYGVQFFGRIALIQTHSILLHILLFVKSFLLLL